MDSLRRALESPLTALAVIWVAVLAVFLMFAGRRGLWPEGLVVGGLLGVTALGADSPLALLFWAVAALGVAGRVGWLGRRVARVAMR